jgi:hypothetical protein
MRPVFLLLTWAVFAVTIATAAAALVAHVLSPGGADAGAAVVLAWVAYAVVGLVISTRRPGDRIGALLLAMGLASTLLALTDELTGGLRGDPDSAAWVAGVPLAAWVIPLLLNLWAVAFTLLPVLLLVFPTGRPLSRRWGAAVWIAFAMIPVGLITAGTSRAVPRAYGLFPLLPSIFGQETGEALREAGQGIFGVFQLVLFVVSAVSLVVRYRRAAGAERAQLKWLAYAALVLASVFVGTAVAFFSPLRTLDPSAPIPPAMFGGIPFILALVAIPIAVGIAILRYRLYDIDLVINRTLVYGLVSATLVVTYLGTVLLLQTLLRPFTSGSELAVAGSTLAVVALFQPLRRRIQETVDRRFYRSRYDAARTLDTFAARLRNQVELDALRAELLRVVGETVRPAHASLWLRRS